MPGRKKKQRCGKERFIIRITPAGWVLFAISLVVVIVSTHTGEPMMFFVFGFLIGAILVSLPAARSNLTGISVERELPERVWQYEKVYFGYNLRNHHRLFACLGLGMYELGDGEETDAGGYCLCLPGKSGFRAGGYLFAGRRGELRINGIRLESTFPLGLVKTAREIPGRASVLVWPARGMLKVDILKEGAVHSGTIRPGRRPSGQDEFFGLRDYRQGDDPRWIHWRRSAGRALPVMREMSLSAPDSLFIILDIAAGGSEADRAVQEYVLRFTATLVVHSLERGSPVGMVVSSGGEVVCIPPGGSRGTGRELLDALGRVGDERIDAAALAEHIPRQCLVGSRLIVVSCHPGRIDHRPIHALAGMNRNLTVMGPDYMETIFEDACAADSEVRHAG